ncbi:MAG: AAA family ATPase [Acidimicrobiales bacterium]
MANDAHPPKAVLVYLYGPPAVGKLTVAKALEARTGYRLFHNHLTVNALTPVFDFGSAPFGDVLHRLRLDVFANAARNGVNVIFTNNSAWRGESGRQRFASFAEEAASTIRENGGRVLFVQLTASPDMLVGRVARPSRREHGKLLDAERLLELVATHDPAPLHPDDLVIDTGALTPDEAADAIVTRLQAGGQPDD